MLYLKATSSFSNVTTVKVSKLSTELRLAYNRNFDLTFYRTVRSKKENPNKDFSSIIAALDS